MTVVTPTDEEPILRVQVNGGMVRVETLVVADLDGEFPRYPLTWLMVEALVRDGEYDDSDDLQNTCLYTTDRGELVCKQLEALVARTKAAGYWCHGCLDDEGGNGAEPAGYRVDAALDPALVGRLVCLEHADVLDPEDCTLVAYSPPAEVPV
jgi:hypothetical protein